VFTLSLRPFPPFQKARLFPSLFLFFHLMYRNRFFLFCYYSIVSSNWSPPPPTLYLMNRYTRAIWSKRCQAAYTYFTGGLHSSIFKVTVFCLGNLRRPCLGLEAIHRCQYIPLFSPQLGISPLMIVKAFFRLLLQLIPEDPLVFPNAVSPLPQSPLLLRTGRFFASLGTQNASGLIDVHPLFFLNQRPNLSPSSPSDLRIHFLSKSDETFFFPGEESVGRLFLFF